MVPPPDDTPESLDAQATRDGEPDRPVEESVGEGETAGNDPSTDSGGKAFGEDWTPPKTLDDDRYRLEDELGRGGMGVVYQARDTQLKRTVAVKLLSRGNVARFQTEAEAVAQLNHTNIAHVYEFDQQDDLHYIVMEHVEGESLLDRLRRDGTIPVEEAIRITVSLCDALAHAHGKGIIHRDIKPSNVLLSNEGEPKLVDFGLARIESHQGQHTRAGAMLGTLDYMSPEQRRDAADVDHRSDQWSLAATLYQLVTADPPRVIDLESVPQQLRRVLAKALKSKENDRYPSVAEFRQALRGCLAAGEVVIDLGANECPKCHANNEARRKFCRECAESLRVVCLKCETKIPIWDKVCGECGGRQQELVAIRRAEMDTQRDQAESLYSEFAFDKSLDIAREIGSIEDVRLQHLKEWSEAFAVATETEKRRQEQDAMSRHANAKTNRKAFNYKSALQEMEAIPEAMQAPEMSSYLRQLRSDHDESQELIQTISERVQRRDLDGLLKQVNRTLELRGDREDLQKLQWQLLTILLEKLKADEALDPEEVVAMWRASDGCRKLNPRHENIAEVQEQLFERIVKSAETYAHFEELADVWRQLPKLPTDVIGLLPAGVIALLPAETNSIGMQFKLILPGTFSMGTASETHKVTLTKPYYLGATKVTQRQYENVMSKNPSKFNGPDNPVERVSWDDAVEFCRRLSALPEETAAGHVYRLPTEAEWEYACRAGTTTAYSFGNTATRLHEYGWFLGNSRKTTHPVGTKKPNPWCLYDIHGNVTEWCQDWYGEYPSGTVIDPTGATLGKRRVFRAGSFNFHAITLRSASRNLRQPCTRITYTGFRAARTYR